jgi:hypothetical protein
MRIDTGAWINVIVERIAAQSGMEGQRVRLTWLGQ